jgi:O-methyltransferase
MAFDRTQNHAGWKRRLGLLFEFLVLSVPFLTELFNQSFSKTLAILAGWHYLCRSEIEGDYLEFGVYRGDTFRNAILASRQGFRSSKEGRYTGRFFAFDSFEGLPSADSMQTGSNPWAKGEFSASQEEFRRTLGSLYDASRVFITPGWFDRSLTPARRLELQLEKAAFVNIDCDLYESTVPVLEFVTPLLQTGTLIYFDDWYSTRGNLNDGEARACSEWLKRHPEFSLTEYRNVGIFGKMFLVNVKHG